MILFPFSRNILFNDEKPDKDNTKTTMWVHDPVALLSIQNLQMMTSEANVNGKSQLKPRSDTTRQNRCVFLMMA